MNVSFARVERRPGEVCVGERIYSQKLLSIFSFGEALAPQPLLDLATFVQQASQLCQELH